LWQSQQQFVRSQDRSLKEKQMTVTFCKKPNGKSKAKRCCTSYTLWISYFIFFFNWHNSCGSHSVLAQRGTFHSVQDIWKVAGLLRHPVTVLHIFVELSVAQPSRPIGHNCKQWGIYGFWWQSKQSLKALKYLYYDCNMSGPIWSTASGVPYKSKGSIKYIICSYSLVLNFMLMYAPYVWICTVVFDVILTVHRR